MKKNNPFTLTFGRKPSEYIERYENTDTIISTFTADNPISQAYLIEGIRGSGKTVLMTSIESKLAASQEWIVVDLNSTQDLMTDLAVRLSDSCKKIPDLRHESFSVSAAGFGFSLDRSSSFHDSVIVIQEILSSLQKKGKKVLITIDEVQHDRNMGTWHWHSRDFLQWSALINNRPLVSRGEYPPLFFTEHDCTTVHKDLQYKQ